MPCAKDLIGNRYGILTVVEKAGTNKWGNVEWLCKCDCGNETVIPGGNLARGNTKSCGCLKSKDLTAQRFGKLTVIKENGFSKSGEIMWLCRCDCGNEKTINGRDLRRGHVVSCRCGIVSRTHGMRNTRIYKEWSGLKFRCSPNADANHKKWYFDRGITVCSEWENSFESFMNWALSNGYQDNLSIDRIDNDGNYEPSNCRWVGRKIQANNTTTNNYIEYNGITKTLTEWAEETGIKRQAIARRINDLNWSMERALTTPVSRKW